MAVVEREVHHRSDWAASHAIGGQAVACDAPFRHVARTAPAANPRFRTGQAITILN
jgi:hypothetical protein